MALKIIYQGPNGAVAIDAQQNVTVSANYTVQPSDYIVTATGAGSFDITLPQAAPNNGRAIVIKCLTTAAITVKAYAGEFIDLVASKSLSNGETLDIVSDGVRWVDTVGSTISGTRIIDGTISNAKLSANAVTDTKIATDAVTTTKIINSAITEAKIANSAVTEAKIATDAVTTTKIINSAVTEAKIANSAVTSNKIASGAITSDKLTYISIPAPIHSAYHLSTTTSGWVRVAQLKNLSSVEFWLKISVSGHHAMAKIVGNYTFIGGVPAASFSLVSNARYGNGYTNVRVLYKGTYDPIYFEVYLPQSAYIAVGQISAFGDTYTNFSNIVLQAGSIPSGYSSDEQLWGEYDAAVIMI